MRSQFLPEVSLTIIRWSFYQWFSCPCMPSKKTCSFLRSMEFWDLVCLRQHPLENTARSFLQVCHTWPAAVWRNGARKPVTLCFLMWWSVLLGFKMLLKLRKNALLTVFAEWAFLFLNKTRRSGACLLPGPLKECILGGNGCSDDNGIGPKTTYLLSGLQQLTREITLQSQTRLPRATEHISLHCLLYVVTWHFFPLWVWQWNRKQLISLWFFSFLLSQWWYF